MEFMTGDTVEIIKQYEQAKAGLVGVVICPVGQTHLGYLEKRIGVDFGANFSGHTLWGTIETHTGYWVPKENLCLICGAESSSDEEL